MKHVFPVLLTMTCAACGIDPTAVLPPPPPLPALVFASAKEIRDNKAASGSYMVAFRQSSSSAMLNYPSFGAESRAHYGLLRKNAFLDPRVKDLHFISALDLNDPGSVFKDPEIKAPDTLLLALNQSTEPLVGSLARVDFRSAEDAKAVLDQWEKEGRIWFAEPNYMSELGSMDALTSTNLGVFGEFKETYENTLSKVGWHQDIELTSAYAAMDELVPTFDGTPPIIAIMDSGVDYDHPALAQNMFENADTGETFCGGNDLHGCNTTNPQKGSLGDGDVAPYGAGGVDKECKRSEKDSQQCDRQCCHGTHVAGIAAGVPKTDSGTAIGGVCPLCQIMVLRVVGDNPNLGAGGDASTILDSSIAGAFKYASQFRRCSGPDCAPLRVINASFGKFQRSRSIGVLVSAITDTPNNRGVLVVGAAGNEDSMRIQYPAGYADAIAVANVEGRTQPKAVSSNLGRWVDVSAPGQQIISSVPGPGGQTEPKSGTSMAAPVVAGLAGLLAVIDEDMSISEMRRRLLEGADPSLYENDINQAYLRDLGDDGVVPLLGSGTVNANNAVNAKATDGRPSVLALDRIEPGCGMVGDERTPRTLNYLWLLLPLLVSTVLQLRRLLRE